MYPLVEMEQHPASRASHGRHPRQRDAAPRSSVETPWQQAAVSWCWMDACRGWSRGLGIGGASRLRGRSGSALHTHFLWTLCYQPQPDVRRLDLAPSRSRPYHAERVDDRIASSCSKIHPPDRSSRRAHARASVRGRVPSVPKAGSSIPLTAGAEYQDISVLFCNYSMRKLAEAGQDQFAGVSVRCCTVAW